ncbi:2-succinyl-5-enolpyruvyl-6-hydroxy-3-cyclohexene-1-carboxylic-acid synthase [Miniimonas sp. S16]|uniref:2-succinyl-5-enolpyruvyl-6-hydroxy-3- cyclohexene-1-carboxylic-acid synthase n=1 Tax=Miniimonas sp. S16 TaxID=2171623 RepID=UPI0018FF3BBD|nr:2-succinyl-5-enolpyruvyl-6-hydroxy-3-cyclohexene-1-carboxylic-acid synthase [Miniimonas sp. S16]
MAQALAETVVAALVAGGVRDVVLAPGSRSAPMAYALLAAEEAGALRLHVVVDERSAGFQALGLAVATRRPVPVVVTSGSAVANLHPALVEAGHQRVPLVVVSCDRPAALVRQAASQTTEHVGMFGDAGGAAGGVSRPRAVVEVSDPGEAGLAVGRVLERALGPLPGPVHLNVPFSDPLVPRASVVETFLAHRGDGTAHERPTASAASVSALAPVVAAPGTVVVAGDGAGPQARELAAALGAPLLAEPSSGARGPLGGVPRAAGWPGDDAARPLPATPVLLDVLGAQVRHAVVLGRPTLSRQVTRLLARDDVAVTIVDPPGRAWLDVPDATHVTPGGEAPRAGGRAVLGDGDGDDCAWGERWAAAGLAVDAALDAEVAAALAGGPLEGWVVARLVSDAVRADDGVLVAGASMAIRELDLAGVAGVRVVASRGVAGIDGTVSTAVGHALAGTRPEAIGPVRVLLGDLTLQHDLGGLARGRRERPIDLQVVVLADDGGSIFATLEHGRPEHAAAHERVFATPQALDVGAYARAVGAAYTEVTTAHQLLTVLGSPVRGVGIVEVRLSRVGAAARRAGLLERLRSAAGTAAGTAAG